MKEIKKIYNEKEVFDFFKKENLFGNFGIVVIGDNNKNSYQIFVKEDNIEGLQLQITEYLEKENLSDLCYLEIISKHHDIVCCTREGSKEYLTFTPLTKMNYDTGYSYLTQESYNFCKRLAEKRKPNRIKTLFFDSYR